MRAETPNINEWLPPFQGVLNTNLLLLKHVPNKLRPGIGCVLAVTVWDFVRAFSLRARNTALARIFLRLMMILVAMPHFKKRSLASNEGAWIKECTQISWEEVTRAALKAFRLSKRVDSDTLNRNRVNKLAPERASGKAIDALKSNRICNVTDEVEQ